MVRVRMLVPLYVLLVGLASLVSLAPVGGDGSDLWFHLATGNWMLEHGRIPAEDPFAHTTAGRALVVHGWLADLALAGVHRAAGFHGLRAFQVTLVASALLAWGALLQRFGWTRSLSATLPFLALALFADRIRLRPDLASFLLFPAFVLLLDRWHAAGRLRCWPALFALALVALWANLHPAVLLTPVLASALWLGDRWRRRHPILDDATAGAGLPLAALPLLLLATLCNPYGPELYVYALSVGRDVGSLVGEWGSSSSFIDIPSHWGHALAPFAVSALLVASALRGEARDPSRSWLGVGLICLLYALSNARFLYLVLIPVATCLPGTWRRPRSLAYAAAVALAAIAMLAATRGSFIRFALQHPETSLRPGHYPIGAVQLLEQLPSPPLRTWHEWNWGGFLAFSTRGQLKIFADGRLVLYGRDLLVDQQVMVERAPRARKEAFLARHAVQALIVPPGMWPRGEPWFRVWSSGLSEVFLHRERARGHLHWILARFQAQGARVIGVERTQAEDAIARLLQTP